MERLQKILSDEGISLPLQPFVQGFVSFAPAVDSFERALLDRRLQHNGNPLLRWQAGNVVVETDAASNRKPAKNKSLDRIDAIVAAIMAVGISSLPDKEEKPEYQVFIIGGAR
jgi:phage terminase large subunit-like protein